MTATVPTPLGNLVLTRLMGRYLGMGWRMRQHTGGNGVWDGDCDVVMGVDRDQDDVMEGDGGRGWGL